MIIKKVLERMSWETLSHEIMPIELNKLFSIHELTSLSKKELINLIINYKANDLLLDKKVLYHVINSLSESELKFIKKECNLDFLREKKALLQFIWANDLYNCNKNFSKALSQVVFGINEEVNSKLTEKKGEGFEIISAPQERFFELFDYQVQIKQQVLSRISSKGILLKMFVHMPTGSGKTKTIIHTLIDYYINVCSNQGAIIWLAHTNELIEQAFESFKSAWKVLGNTEINIYRVYDKYTLPTNSAYHDGVFFISYQKAISLSKNNENFEKLIKKCCLLVVDEAHKSVAKETQTMIDKIMTKKENYLNRHLIGLSATPGRVFDYSNRNKSLVSFFDNQLISINIEKLQDIKLKRNYINAIDDSSVIKFLQSRGILATINRELIEYDSDYLKEIQAGKGEDYSYEFLNRVGMDYIRNKVIIKKIEDLYIQQKQVIIFACSVSHAKLINAILTYKGIVSKCVFASMTDAQKNERKQAISDFKNNKLKILINYEVLTTGFDSKNVDCILIARPTKSIVLYSQMIGRGLRGPKMGGKEVCQIIDVKDNFNRYTDESDAFNYFNSYWG